MGLIHKNKNQINYDTWKKMLETIATMQDTITKLQVEIEELKKTKTIEIKQLSKQEKEEIRQKYMNSLTPEKLVEAFAGDVEEFYPNGKPTNN